MRVVEAFTESKSTTRPNEDAYVVTGGYAAVVDGATDKSGIAYRWEDETVSSGRFAAQVAVAAVGALDVEFDAPPDAAQAVAFIGGRLDVAVRAQQPGVGAHQRPACSLVVYSRARHEVWSVGDCSWAFGGVHTRGGKAIDELTASLRADVTAAHLDDGWSVEQVAEVDPGRQAIHSLLSFQGVFANRVGDLGYGAVNGTPVPGSFTAVTRLSGDGVLTLTSDGYPEILDGRVASEQRLFDLVREDPLCIGPLLGPKSVAPAATSYDDRTWLSLRV